MFDPRGVLLLGGLKTLPKPLFRLSITFSRVSWAWKSLASARLQGIAVHGLQMN